MPKIRLRKKKIKYATVSRNLLSSPKISLKAKGLGAWLELHQDGFELNFEFILQNMKEGRDTLRKTIKELKEQDFLITIQSRNKKGRFETTWIFDSEGEVKDLQLEPTTETNESVTQYTVNQYSVKSAQIRKLNNKSKKKKTLSTEREDFIKNFDTFISYMRSNFINKEILSMKDKYTQSIIRISVSSKGFLYNLDNNQDFDGTRAKELWSSLHKIAKSNKLQCLDVS
jgi:hypothetical protein